jgi:hypothetical protein
MAYILSDARHEDVMGAYRRYQQYLKEHELEFPPNAFALATAEWYLNPSDHRCPHDSQLDSMNISEMSSSDENRITSIYIRLLGAYNDGHIEFHYSRIFSYILQSPSCAHGLGDWLYDEFRLSSDGHLIHEIEWAGFPSGKGARWIFEASDVEFRWIPRL